MCKNKQIWKDFCIIAAEFQKMIKTKHILVLMLALMMSSCTDRETHGDQEVRFTIEPDHSMESPLKTTVQLFHKAAPKPHFMTWENFKNTLANITNQEDQ